jgi:hypothetical protein
VAMTWRSRIKSCRGDGCLWGCDEAWVSACCPAEMWSTPRFGFLGARMLEQEARRSRRDGVCFVKRW